LQVCAELRRFDDVVRQLRDLEASARDAKTRGEMEKLFGERDVLRRDQAISSAAATKRIDALAIVCK
jgi:hypothetical protein